AAAVGLLELHQRHAAFTGVPVGEERQMQAALAGDVEGVHVLRLHLAQPASAQVPRQCIDEIAQSLRQLPGHLLQQRQLVHQLLLGVLQQQRDALPRRGLDPGVQCGRSAPVAAPQSHHCCSVFASSSFRSGKSPSGIPLPSQFSRFTRLDLEPPPTSSSEVFRFCNMAMFSMATGVGRPEPSPNGAEPRVSSSSKPLTGQSVASSSSECACSVCAGGITYRSSYLASASSRYIAYISSSVIPTASQISAWGSLPRFRSRI